MFASLLRQQTGRRTERTPLLAASDRYKSHHGEHADGHSDEDNYMEEVAHYDGEDEHDEDEDHGGRDGPLLPVFSEFLDRIPIYNTTHAIRILVVQRCETTLSWDQLRSPQVSQFLVKPIQQQLLASHFSRATLYCLIANCLQFRKEGEANPGNVGVSRSRALICELLAMRLLKEFSTRELIDALSYDFDPLQGMVVPTAGGTHTPGGNRAWQSPRSARISTLEVAIRAQAKKFLAHPLVVQQLEAIWAGTIVFQNVADNLHRKQDTSPGRHQAAMTVDVSPGRGPSQHNRPTKQGYSTPPERLLRRTVTLYDPHDASLFKLSRLRVPRYRNLFSMLSFAIMLGLFLAALAEKSDDITALEVLFWFWSAGYMLDEIVGFSEQGFGLYIMSVWNAFDLGILLMFMVYYVLRLYGILVTDTASRRYVSLMAYDVLGSTAVLLFPRLFSALDHYRYFSQLLIAFRMMAMDLVAILLLIIITCSGFFVAFTLSFKKDFNAPHAAYALFQMLMGFTPAAWEIWDDFNPLGKTLLTLFLFICHFLIVTILITVLTNSFMAIVQNANEEHQFLFAVNTISMVKSDALFSYIAPTNILGWLLIPLKYCMPFRSFVRMNRLLIKVTHVPILFTIFFYERVLLSNLAYGPTDLIEERGRAQVRKSSAPAFSLRGPMDVFSPGTRLREPSITTFHKDRALDEVFRRPFQGSTNQGPTDRQPRRNSSNVVTDWMKGIGNDGDALPPQEDTQSTLDRLEVRNRPSLRRTKTAGHVQYRHRHPLALNRTASSDPDDNARPFNLPIAEEEEGLDMSMESLQSMEDQPQTDADGDDELAMNEDEERMSPHTVTQESHQISDKENRAQGGYETSEDEFFRTPMTARPISPRRTPAFTPSRVSASGSSPSSNGMFQGHKSTPSRGNQKPTHARNVSTNTVLFSPSRVDAEEPSRTSSPTKHTRPSASTRSGTATPGHITFEGQRTPKRPGIISGPSRPRPIMPPRNLLQSSQPNIAAFLALDARKRDPSFNARALDLASDLGDNRHGPDYGVLGALPASFTTQLEMAARMQDRHKGNDEESTRMSRIMLARMTTLEEGFRDVLREIKGFRRGSEDGIPSRANSKSGTSPPNEPSKRKGKGRKKSVKKDGDGERMGSSV